MSPSPESVAVRSPLSLVAGLYARNSSSSSSAENESEAFFADVAERFASVLADHADSIPRLEDVNTPGRLARFRCMVQDTGLPNEVYVLDVGGEGGRGCCAYSEGAASGSPIIGYEATDYSKLRERQVIYATSVPGETAWYKQAQDKTPSTDGDSLAEDISSRLHVGRASSSSSSSLANKFPLPDTPHTGALVKIYPLPEQDQASKKSARRPYHIRSVKTTEVMEFIGVLDYSAFPSSASLEEPSTAEAAASNSSQLEQVKTLHAIYKLPVNEAAAASEASQSNVDAKAAREELIEHLSNALEGDTVAAEWLLLSLLSRIYARRGALAIGQLPMNIVLPQSTDNACEIVKSLNNVLQDLLPRLVKLDFEVGRLNSSSYMPHSANENLISGVLQLPEGTTLLVDETRMGEGTLQDKGVKNIQALATVIKDQTLAYVFPYSSFTFETDLRAIIVSKGKSLLPMDCIVPVRPTRSSRSSNSAATPAQLGRWRRLLSPATSNIDGSAAITIPDEISEHIQSDFVSMRQSKTATQEDFVLRMTVARLLAQSQGKTELDKEVWEATKALDEVRKARLVQ